MNLEIKPIGPGLLEDYLEFFDNIAFSDNPDWAGCYCYFHHFDKPVEEWTNQTREKNRTATAMLIQNGAMKGYLAFIDGKPAGWCNSNRKTAYTLLPENPGSVENDKNVRAIICFIVASEHRRKGIASSMLDRVCADAAIDGFEAVEAYPPRHAEGDAHNYMGPLSMYLTAGFSIVASYPDHDVVRKNLR